MVPNFSSSVRIAAANGRIAGLDVASLGHGRISMTQNLLNDLVGHPKFMSELRDSAESL
jgi:hypothetical protein